MNLRLLNEPFTPDEIEWRVLSAGKKDGNVGVWAKIVPFLKTRSIQERLDEVCGPENWENKFEPGPAGGVLCSIGIRYGTHYAWKCDGSENTQIDPVKGGLTGAFKRAASMWGIGRYLSSITDVWATVQNVTGSTPGARKCFDRQKDLNFWWVAPQLPFDHVPGGDCSGRNWVFEELSSADTVEACTELHKKITLSDELTKSGKVWLRGEIRTKARALK